MTSSPRASDLDPYRTQARELLRRVRAGDLEALARLRRSHPDPGALAAPGRPRLVDCQLVLARELGYRNWARLARDLLYRRAVAALDAGDLDGLDALLRENPSLIRHRGRHGEGYDRGYFRGAALLHHVAGNPLRHPIPANVLEVADVLLRHGADPNVATDEGWTTIGLLLTSRPASEAGVAVPLIDRLRAAGAKDDLTGPDALTQPLLNQAPATADALLRRGVVPDVRHAAGLGRLDQLATLLDASPDAGLVEEALVFACIRGQTEAARLLVRRGARGDVLVGYRGEFPATALHEAANRGHREIVTLLLEHGADASVVEPRWGGTPAGWAEHGGQAELAAILREHQRRA